MYVLQVSVLGCDSRLERDGTDSMGWRVICPPDHTGTDNKHAPRSVEAPWDEEAVRQLCPQENTRVPIGVINRNNSRHSSSNCKHQTQTNETWTQVRCCSTYLGVPASSEAIVPLRFQVALWYPPSMREPAQYGRGVVSSAVDGSVVDSIES